jgi:hypothetical protein
MSRTEGFRKSLPKLEVVRMVTLSNLEVLIFLAVTITIASAVMLTLR